MGAIRPNGSSDSLSSISSSHSVGSHGQPESLRSKIDQKISELSQTKIRQANENELSKKFQSIKASLYISILENKELPSGQKAKIEKKLDALEFGEERLKLSMQKTTQKISRLNNEIVQLKNQFKADEHILTSSKIVHNSPPANLFATPKSSLSYTKPAVKVEEDENPYASNSLSKELNSITEGDQIDETASGAPIRSPTLSPKDKLALEHSNIILRSDAAAPKKQIDLHGEVVKGSNEEMRKRMPEEKEPPKTQSKFRSVLQNLSFKRNRKNLS